MPLISVSLLSPFSLHILHEGAFISDDDAVEASSYFSFNFIAKFRESPRRRSTGMLLHCKRRGCSEYHCQSDRIDVWVAL